MPATVPAGIVAVALAVLLLPELKEVAPTVVLPPGPDHDVGLCNCRLLFTVPASVTVAGRELTEIEEGDAEGVTVV